MQEVARGLNLPRIFLDSYSSWHQFVDNIFQQIEFKPIQYPEPLNKTGKAQWERCIASPVMLAESGHSPRLVSKIVMGRVDAQYGPDGEEIDEAGWHWSVHLAVPDASDGDVLLQFPAWHVEPRSAFRFA
jgi:hypothetical protein